MNFKNKIGNFILRMKNYFEKMEFNPPESLSENQELIIKIFETSLLNPDSELLIAPISLTYYINVEDIFIILDDNRVRIINGKYEYHILIPIKTQEKLRDKFKNILESRRKKMEQSIISKTTRNLSQILQDISEKK